MRIAIVTLVGNFNYGNRLQNYAMTRILEGCGHEVCTLVFPKKTRLSYQNIKFKVNCLLGRARDPEKAVSADRLARFNKFNQYLSFVHVNGKYSKLNNEYDAFVVGSDQVWNPEFLNDPDAYFATFADREKRIAVAASFGVESIPPKQKALYRKYLGEMACISTREEAGTAIVAELTGRDDACCVVDPTLVLDAAAWRKTASYDMCPSVPFVFVYMLGLITDEQRDFINSYARNHDLKLVLLSDRDDSNQLPAGPADFIGLIDTASCVITNSFHGSVLASIFKTPLYVLKRNGNDPTFSRLITLSNKLGLGLRSDSDSLALRATFANVDYQLQQERNKFCSYLESAGLVD